MPPETHGTPKASIDEAKESLKGAITQPSEYGIRQWIGWVLGPAFLLFTLFVTPPTGLTGEGWRALGMAGLMATWWVCEAIPIPATSLLPLVLIPLLNLASIKEAAAPYANPIVFLFLGGFIITLAMQRWNLHRRIALNLISWMGTRPSNIVAGFLLAASLVSMWVNNTATALMMYPIALSVACLMPEDDQQREHTRTFRAVLMLAVAYGSTAGGMATLVGTVPNALMAAFLDETYHYQIGFGRWMFFGIPVTLVAIPAIHFVLTRFAFKLDRHEVPGMWELIALERQKLGPLTRGEIGVGVIFLGTATAWVFQPLFKPYLPMITDTAIAMTGALLLFMIPIDLRRGTFVMNWQAAKGLPWDVLLLFGGGLTLAATLDKHGVSKFLGNLFIGLEGVPIILLTAILCFSVLMITELTSNTAVAVTFLPIVGAIATSIGENPMLFLIPTALAANAAFMLPVGTPPNAIVFGSGMVSLPQMARTGIWLNLLFVPLIVFAVILLGRFVFGIELGVLPDWAQK